MNERPSSSGVAAHVCPYCGKTAVLTDGVAIYGRSFGNVWVCPGYPECDSYVGCHKGTKKPLGRMANRELRLAKMAAHNALDRLWRYGEMSRRRAYLWLADSLGIPFDECHIGMFDVETCKKVVDLIQERDAK